MNTLICIYSSHEDLHLAEKLRYQIDNSIISDRQENIIVLSNVNQKEEFNYDKDKKILYLKVKECYTYLSLKTELMIKACVKLFNFDFMVKWDASTFDQKRCYHNAESPKACMQYINSKKFINKHYSSHLNALCNGAESKAWFNCVKSKFSKVLQAEGRDLECESFIPKKVPYCRGKFYIMSNKFCNFISRSKKCEEIFRKNFQHNFGNEDMSVGMCFKHFKRISIKP